MFFSAMLKALKMLLLLGLSYRYKFPLFFQPRYYMLFIDVSIEISFAEIWRITATSL